MKQLLTVTAVTILTFQSLYAEGMKCCSGAMKMPHTKSATNSSLLSKIQKVDGYDVSISSDKSLIVGNNTIKVALFKDGKKVDAKVKAKFFMPQMPGMPYMESKVKGKTTDGVYDAKINFSMGGTWQYQIKFKTDDGEVHKVKGSVNL